MKTGAEILVDALEQSGVVLTFGIPGAQNLELYDAIDRSDRVVSILVTDEQCASFMADGAARSTGHIACINLVPGAGLTQAISGIAEAFMDGVPMLVLSTGVRTDIEKSFQLHDIPQVDVVAPITKNQWRVEALNGIGTAIRDAIDCALAPPQGPTMIEIPAQLLIARGEVSEVPPRRRPETIRPSADLVGTAVDFLEKSDRPLLYLGHGARAAGPSLIDLAERIGAPVATTLHGKGVFPETHPNWLWCGFGPTAPKQLAEIADACDLTIAIGCRFAEVGTGSYGLHPPGPLIHVDIDPGVFNRNYEADLTIAADAGAFVDALLQAELDPADSASALDQIRQAHDQIDAELRRADENATVHPPRLFKALQSVLGDQALYSVDSGNGLFMAVESLRLDDAHSFLAPVDFSCMGYAVPSAIGAAIARPDRPVVAVAGDGAFLMTCTELASAAQMGVGLIAIVLRDKELTQIAQFQDTAFGRRVASDLPDFDLCALSTSLGAVPLKMSANGELESTIRAAEGLRVSGRVVVIECDVNNDVRTYFTKGVIRTNFGRLTWGDRAHFVERMIFRNITG